MKQRRLFGVGIPQACGGLWDGGDGIGPFGRLSRAGWTLAAHGGNLGVCLSFMVHELTALCLIYGLGTNAQKTRLLPRLCAGESSIALAVSEPGAGAHPKRLSATASPRPGGFVINGEKTYLTNATLADEFVVIAASGTEGDKKAFTAFLVPKTAPGLTVSPPLAFPHLRPAPHGGIVLKDCPVGADQVVGTPGRAYDQVVLAFREVEDIVMMGPLAGGLSGLAAAFFRLLRHRPRPVDGEETLIMGAGLHCAALAMSDMAEAAADRLDKEGGLYQGVCPMRPSPGYESRPTCGRHCEPTFHSDINNDPNKNQGHEWRGEKEERGGDKLKERRAEREKGDEGKPAALPPHTTLAETRLVFRLQTQAWLEKMAALSSGAGLTHQPSLAAMQDDLFAMLRIAANASHVQILKLGNRLLSAAD